jgi:2,3-dihydroxybiphenyl 1,2-dioxygenase
MQIRALGYAGIVAKDLPAWRDFAADVLGLQVIEEPGRLRLRMDDRAQRLVVLAGERDGLDHMGWDVGDAQSLSTAVRTLRERGVGVQPGTPAEIAQRQVQDLVWLRDPLGNRIELYHGLAAAPGAFTPARPTGGFRTGELGFGHAVLAVPDIDAVLPFYRDVLGLRLSDYATAPFRAVFLHVNARHHSLAMLEMERSGVHHLMIEALSLDDLGRAYDAALERDLVRVTLGRHTNDHMTSFYAASPSGFMVEFGWGGRSVDDATWQVTEMTHGPSLWGHERTWLGPEKRAEARALRLKAAADGLHAPVHVVPGFGEGSDR